MISEEDRKWLEQLIKENKESDNELTYTYCPFRILYNLQQENQSLKDRIEKAIEYIETTPIGSKMCVMYGEEVEYTEPLLEILKGYK